MLTIDEIKLFKAIQDNNFEQVKGLLAYNVNINARNSLETTFLIEAVKTGNIKIVELILDCKDIDIHAKDGLSATALTYAKYIRNPSIKNILEERGAK